MKSIWQAQCSHNDTYADLGEAHCPMTSSMSTYGALHVWHTLQVDTFAVIVMENSCVSLKQSDMQHLFLMQLSDALSNMIPC